MLNFTPVQKQATEINSMMYQSIITAYNDQYPLLVIELKCHFYGILLDSVDES